MKVISKSEARALSLPRYFTGAPCRRGHVAERFINSGRCVECNKVLVSAWKSSNGDLKRQMDRDYRAANRERVRAAGAAWYALNRDHVIQKSIAHAKANPDSARRRRKNWKIRNPEYVLSDAAVRRSRKRMSVPPWSGELDALVWLEAADLVRLRSAATGFAWHADHMIPLACRKASGLHVWNNCQVIPAAINNAKKNKLVLTEPGQWISHTHQNF